MTVAAKYQLVSDVTQEVGEFLTLSQVNSVSQVLTNKLTAYDVTEIHRGETDPDSLNLLEMFLNAKQIEGRSKKTVERYSYILERMIREIGVPVNRITVHHLRTYLMDLKKTGLQDSSLEGIRSIMSSFFGWLWKENMIQANPCGNLGAIKVQKKIRKPYSQIEIEKLKNGCTNLRDKAIVCFLLSTGARISEVCALDRDSIDFQSLECTVLGKGNKERTVYLNEVTAMAVQEYLNARADTYPALFAGNRDSTDRLTPHGVRNMLTSLGERTGVENVHPHRFRRTLATNLIDHGMPIQEVAFILGHERLDTTMKYIYMGKENVKHSYQRYC